MHSLHHRKRNQLPARTPMNDGIYHITVATHGNHASIQGVVVIQGQAIKGGGQGYLIQGRLQEQSQALSGNVVITKWSTESPPTLGMFKQVTMPITGMCSTEEHAFSFHGYANGHHAILLEGEARFIAEL